MKKTWKIKLAVPIIAFCLTAVQPIPAYAAKEDITAVITAIDSLPSSEDLNDSYAPQVEDIWKAYQELTMAEKINVSNYDKLEKEYKMLLDSGAIVDNEAAAEEEQSKIDRERNSVAVSGKTEAQTTDYTFQISSSQPALSVVIRYTTDANGDNDGDVPGRIVLVSPNGTSTPVSNATSNMSDDTMDIALTWTKNYLQMDIASASEGKWTISTDIPVTYSAIDYAGGQQVIEPESETAAAKVTEQVYTEETEAGEIAAEPKKASVLPLVGGLALIIAMIVGLIIGFKKVGKTSSSKKPTNPAMQAKLEREKKKNEKSEEEEIPKAMTDEEIIAEMRREYHERIIQESQMMEADEEMEKAAMVGDDDDDIGLVSQQDIDEDETIEEYTEGDTGLLNQRNNPANMRTKGHTTFNDDEDDDPFA